MIIYILAFHFKIADYQKCHPNNDVQCVQASHEKVKTEVQQMTSIQQRHQVRTGLKTVFNFMSPFKILIKKKRRSTKQRNTNKDKCPFLVVLLNSS